MKLIPDSQYFEVTKASFWRRFAISNFERRSALLLVWMLLCPVLAVIGFYSQIQFFQVMAFVALLHVVLGFESKAVLDAVENLENKVPE